MGHLAFEELRLICFQLRNDSKIRGKNQLLEVLELKMDAIERKYFSTINEEVMNKNTIKKGITKQPVKKHITLKPTINRAIDWAKVWKDDLLLPI